MLKNTIIICILTILFYSCSSDKIQKEPSASRNKPLTKEEKSRAAMDHFIKGSLADIKADYSTAILEYQEALALDPTPGIYFALGKDYLTLSKLPLALKNTHAAINGDSTNIAYYQLLADVHLAAHETDSAAAAYEKIIQLDSTNISAYYSLGLLYEKSKPLAALSIYKKLSDITGPEWSILIRIAEISERLGNTSESISTLEELRNIDPANVELQKLLVQTYIKASKYEEAHKVLDESLQQFPDDPSLLELKAQIYIQQDKWQEAAREYGSILNKRSVPFDTKLRIGSIYLARSMQDSTMLPVAKEFFQKLDQDTVSWQVKMILGEIALREKKDSAAISHFKEVTTLAKWNADAWIRLGGLLFDNKKYQQASEILTEAVENFPDDFAINLILGLSLSQENNYSKAKDYLKKAVQLNSKDITALSAYGYTLNQLKEPDQAIYYLSEALKIDPANVELLGTLGLIYNAQKKWKECDSVYTKALQIDSTNALVLNNYAYSLSERGIRLEEALVMVRKALDKDPENSSYLDTIGWIYFQLNNYPEAINFIKKALAIDSKNATITEHLGDVIFKTGDKAAAIELWQKALNLNSDNPELKKKIEKGEL